MSPVRLCLIAATALALAACAPLPSDLPTRPDLATPEVKQIVTQDANVAAWPASPWWCGFKDQALDGLIERALTGNPTLAAVQSRIDAAQRLERLAEINAGVNADASIAVNRDRLTATGIFPPPIGGSRYTQEDVSVGVAYSFDWWGKNRALIAAARGDQAAAVAERDAVRLAISTLVADAYFAQADATARATAACASVDARRDALRLTRIRLQQGLDAADRVRKAEGALAQDEDQCQALTYQDRAARYRLAALLGQGPDVAAGLPTAQLATPLALPVALPLDWLAKRPDVAAQRARTEAEAARSDAVRADFYPDIDLKLLAGLQSIKIEKWLTRDSFNGSVGPALHIPLFSTHTLQARLGLAESAYAAAVADYNRTVIEAARQAADGYTLAATLEQRHAAQAEALAAAQRAASLSATRHQRGLTDSLEAINSRLLVLAQQQADTQLQAAHLRAQVALAQALGASTREITGTSP